MTTTSRTNGAFPEPLCYAVDMGDTQPPEPRASVTTADTKAIVGTGIGLATLLLMLVGLMFQQNANVNARFDDVIARVDDVNANMNARFDDVNRRIDDVQDEIGELRAEVRSEIGELRAEVRSDIRELRDIVITALKGSEPAG